MLKVRLGADFDVPHEVKMLQEPTINTYRKLMIETEGTVWGTTAPVEVCVGDQYRVWRLSDKLLIGYDPEAFLENRWWKDLMSKLPEQLQRVPRMYGDLCVYVHWNSLEWDELVLRRELINWLVCKYKRHHNYHFCDFSEDGKPKQRNGRCSVV